MGAGHVISKGGYVGKDYHVVFAIFVLNQQDKASINEMLIRDVQKDIDKSEMIWALNLSTA